MGKWLEISWLLGFHIGMLDLCFPQLSVQAALPLGNLVSRATLGFLNLCGLPNSQYVGLTGSCWFSYFIKWTPGGLDTKF